MSGPNVPETDLSALLTRVRHQLDHAVEQRKLAVAIDVEDAATLIALVESAEANARKSLRDIRLPSDPERRRRKT